MTRTCREIKLMQQTIGTVVGGMLTLAPAANGDYVSN